MTVAISNNRLIQIPEHHEGKWTSAFVFEGKKYITNGCQFFTEDEAEDVYDDQYVSEAHRDEVDNILGRISEDITIEELVLLTSRDDEGNRFVWSDHYDELGSMIIKKLGDDIDGKELYKLAKISSEILRLSDVCDKLSFGNWKDIIDSMLADVESDLLLKDIDTIKNIIFCITYKSGERDRNSIVTIRLLKKLLGGFGSERLTLNHILNSSIAQSFRPSFMEHFNYQIGG